MNRIIKHYISLEKTDRVMFFLIFTCFTNIIVSIFKFIMAFTLPSLWFFINALFLSILSLTRVFSIKDYTKIKLLTKKEDIKRIEKKNYFLNGILLILLGIMYFFVNVYIYYKGTNTNMHEYLTYLVALIAFYAITTSIYGMIKYKKNASPILKAVKITNFASSLTSIMLTQIVLLDTFTTSLNYNSNLMNGLTGMAVGIIIIFLGLYMIIKD